MSSTNRSPGRLHFAPLSDSVSLYTLSHSASRVPALPIPDAALSSAKDARLIVARSILELDGSTSQQTGPRDADAKTITRKVHHTSDPQLTLFARKTSELEDVITQRGIFQKVISSAPSGATMSQWDQTVHQNLKALPTPKDADLDIFAHMSIEPPRSLEQMTSLRAPSSTATGPLNKRLFSKKKKVVRIGGKRGDSPAKIGNEWSRFGNPDPSDTITPSSDSLPKLVAPSKAPRLKPYKAPVIEGIPPSEFPRHLVRGNYRDYTEEINSVVMSHDQAASRKAREWLLTLGSTPRESLKKSLIPRPEWIRPYSEGHSSIEGRERERLEEAWRKQSESLSRNYWSKAETYHEAGLQEDKDRAGKAWVVLQSHINPDKNYVR